MQPVSSERSEAAEVEFERRSAPSALPREAPFPRSPIPWRPAPRSAELAGARGPHAPVARPWAAFPLEAPRVAGRASLRLRPWSLAREVLRTLRAPAHLSLALLGIYLVVFNFSVVRGSSMAPGIHDGDRILIDQLSYWFGSVERGDVVVLRYPPNPELDYIKRVVGLPGDEVVLACGLVWVNGKLLDEPYILEADLAALARVRVSDEHLFVLGDNRPHSSDSREFGLVPIENLRGKVDLRVWPPARFGWIQ